MGSETTPGGPGTAGQLRVHREDDPSVPGKDRFVLRDDRGAEIARTPPFLPDDAPARNARDRLLEAVTGQGWEIARRPDDAFGDAWWDYRFTPGPEASDPAALGQALAAPGVPRSRVRRPRRRDRPQRRIPRPPVGMVLFLAFTVLVLTITVGFLIAVLWLLSS